MSTTACSACGHANPPQSRFCLECGAAIAPPCPRCAAELPAGAKFCNQCGAEVDRRQPIGEGRAAASRSYTPHHLAEKILTSRAAIEGERKQVTVLFADVKSSMEIVEQLDPEEWHGIMDRFFAILSEGVHRFEGTVNQYTGDGIMALFGAPIAHEDHAQRACYAALHIQESLRTYADQLRLKSGLSFAVRIGLNSGEVVVGKIGDDLRMDYTAQGYVVGLAARMEQIAESGRVYLTENTARLAAGYFRLRDLGEAQVKGLSHPVRVHELEGVGTLRTRFDISRARGLSKFVGRAREMAILEEALESTLAGKGGAIGIVAQAGQGKSRLCYEFAQLCRARGVRVHQAQSVAHEKSVPLLPILQLMRSYFGITAADDPSTARDRVAGRVLLLDPGLVEMLPVLFEFLGIPDPMRPAAPADAATRMLRLAEVLRRVGRVRGEREAVVLVLEDLHWIDEASAAFVRRLLEDAAPHRTLLVVNFRPELEADWLTGPSYRQLELQPLGREDLEGLVGDLLGGDASLAPLADWLMQRTTGNPFYVEEVVRALVDEGSLSGAPRAYRLVRPLTNATVPPTVQAILAARIDRLPETQKNVLQAAAVIGREFPESVLARVLAGLPQPLAAEEIEGALQDLADAELIYEQALYPEREYVFKHALTREVAAGAQLNDKRRRLHGAAARALEETAAADKLDEKAASIARHWEAAGEGLPAALWYQRAATWIDARDIAAAGPYWEKVGELARALPESPESRRLEMNSCIGRLDVGFRIGLPAAEAQRLYERGRELAAGFGDAESIAMVESSRTRAQWSAGIVPDANQPAPYDVEDPEMRLGLILNAVLGMQATGNAREAFAMSDQAVAIIEAAPELLATGSGATSMGFRGLIATLLGRLDEAEVCIEAALRAARDNALEEVVGWASGWRATLNHARGDLDAAIADGRRALEIARKIESAFSVGTGTLGFAQALVSRGDFEEAIRVCTGSLESIRTQNAGMMFEAQILTHLAEAQIGVGDLAGARRSIEAALELPKARRMLSVISRTQVVAAELLLRSKGPGASAAVAAELDDAERLIEEGGAELWRPLVHRGRARLAAAQGDEAAAAAEMQTAIELYRRMGAVLSADRLARELAEM